MIERKHKCLIQKLADFTFAGELSEVLPRAEAIGQWLVAHYPRKAHALLKYYVSVLQRVYRKTYITVGFSGCLEDDILAPVLHQLKIKDASHCIKETQPELLGGFKIQHGDDVWDVSLKGQLDAFIKNLR